MDTPDLSNQSLLDDTRFRGVAEYLLDPTFVEERGDGEPADSRLAIRAALEGFKPDAKVSAVLEKLLTSRDEDNDLSDRFSLRRYLLGESGLSGEQFGHLEVGLISAVFSEISSYLSQTPSFEDLKNNGFDEGLLKEVYSLLCEISRKVGVVNDYAMACMGGPLFEDIRQNIFHDFSGKIAVLEVWLRYALDYDGDNDKECGLTQLEKNMDLYFGLMSHVINSNMAIFSGEYPIAKANVRDVVLIGAKLLADRFKYEVKILESDEEVFRNNIELLKSAVTEYLAS